MNRSDAPGIVINKLRWLAIATGCFTAIAGTFNVGGLFFILPSFLILGGVALPHSPRMGRWLMWAGAAILSIWLLPMGAVTLVERVQALRSHEDHGQLLPISLWVVSILLVIWCDVAILVGATKTRGSLVLSAQRTHGAGRWLVWIGALLLSVSFLPASVLGVVAYRRVGRLDVLLFSLASGLLVTLFDVAVLVDSIKGWRARRT